MIESINKKKQVKYISLCYLIALLGMFSIVLAIFVDREKPDKKISEETYQNITSSWTLDQEGTQPVKVKEYEKYIDPKKGVLSIYYQLPEMNSDTSFVYRSKHAYTRVLVDGEQIYETSVYKSRFYNKSPGNLWNVLDINSKYSGKQLELQIITVYDTKSITVDSLFLGDKADIIIGLFSDNIVEIVVSILLVLFGIVLIGIDFMPSYGRLKKHHSLRWVGVYAFLAGGWCLIETNLLQFCVADMRMLQLLDNMLMMIVSVPLILFLNAEVGILENKLMRILSYASIGYIVLCIILHFSGKKDMHCMLKGSLYLKIVFDVATCIWLLSKVIKLKKEKKSAINCFLLFLGVSAVCFCTIFEIIRSLQIDRMDRAGLIRIGMLILSICFAIVSQIETYKIVEQGLKYDFVRKLAYSDGLTGLGNRTAYLENLESCSNNLKGNSLLGIVFLDVNNLKTINDRQGHEQGDKLIQSAAKIIKESFGIFGTCYRIGGDEFCVMMTGDDLEQKYEEGKVIFQHLIDEANRSKLNPLGVQIAHGFAICSDVTKERIEETIKNADSAMYENKSKLKAGNFSNR